MSDEIKALEYGTICAGTDQQAARLCVDVIRWGGEARIVGQQGEQTLVKFNGCGVVAVRDDIDPLQVVRLGYDNRLRRIAHPVADGPRVLLTMGPDGRPIPGEGVTVAAEDAYTGPILSAQLAPDGSVLFGAAVDEQAPTRVVTGYTAATKTVGLAAAADIKTQLSRLVAGEWREHERGFGYRPQGVEWLLSFEDGSSLGVEIVPLVAGGWKAVVSVAREYEICETDDMGHPDPLSALSALCCQPLAVSILHGLGAFPDVDEPDPAWPWWWRRSTLRLHVLESPYEIEGAAEYVRVTAEFWVDSEAISRRDLPGESLWRRAPAPPGWQP